MNNSVKLSFLEKGNVFLNQLDKKNTNISVLKNLSIQYINETLNNLNELNNKYIIDTITPYFIDGKLQLINPANYFLKSKNNLSKNYNILSTEDILNLYKANNKDLYLNVDFPIALNDNAYEKLPIIKSNSGKVYQISVNNGSIQFTEINYEYEIKPVVIKIRNTLYQILINDDNGPKLYCNTYEDEYDYHEIYMNDGDACFTFDMNEVYSLGVLNKYDNIYYKINVNGQSIELEKNDNEYKKVNVRDTLTCFDANGCYKVYIDSDLDNDTDIKFIFEELDHNDINENYIISNSRLYRIIKDNDDLYAEEANDILLISYEVNNTTLYERDIICLKKIDQINAWKKIDIIVDYIISLLKNTNYNWIKNWTIGCNLDRKINKYNIDIPTFKDTITGKYYKLDIQDNNWVLNQLNIYNDDISNYYIKGNGSIYELYVENGQLLCSKSNNDFISNINILYNNEFYDLIYNGEIVLNKRNDELYDFCNPILYVWLMYTLNQKLLMDSALSNLSINWGFPNVSNSLKNLNLGDLKDGNNSIDKNGVLGECIQDNWILNVISTLVKSGDVTFNGITGEESDSINYGISTIISFYIFNNEFKSLENLCEKVNSLAAHVAKLCVKDIEEYERFIINYNDIEVSKDSYTDEVYFNNIHNLYICEKNEVNYTIANINDEEYNTGLYYYDINNCELIDKDTINKIKFIYDYLKDAKYTLLDNIGEKTSSKLINYGKVSYKQLTFTKDNYNIYLITGYINEENISSEIYVNLYADYLKTYLLYNRQEYILVDDEVINIPKNNFLVVYEEVDTLENIDEIEYEIDYKIDNYRIILKSLIKLLSSTYNKELTDLNYYKLLRSMALEYANIKYEKISILKNANVNDVYNDYIYNNFGSLVSLQKRADYSNVKYKNLIKGVIKALLHGSTIQVIEEALKLFFNFNIKLFELYKDEDYEYIQKYNGRMDYSYEQRLYTFWIEIEKDLEEYNEQIDIIDEFKYIINIVKPAHTLAMLMLKMSGEENYRNSYLNKYNTFFTNADKVLINIDWPFTDSYMYDFTNSYLFENEYENLETPYRNILGMFGGQYYYNHEQEDCGNDSHENCNDYHKDYNVFMHRRVKDVYTMADIKFNLDDNYQLYDSDKIFEIIFNIGLEEGYELEEEYNPTEKCNDDKFEYAFLFEGDKYSEEYNPKEKCNDDFSMVMHTPNSIIKINKITANGNLESSEYEIVNIVEEAISIDSINISGENDTTIKLDLIDYNKNDDLQNKESYDEYDNIQISSINISGEIIGNINQEQEADIDIDTDTDIE